MRRSLDCRPTGSVACLPACVLACLLARACECWSVCRWLRAVFEQLLSHAMAAGYEAQCVEYQAVLRWFDVIIA